MVRIIEAKMEGICGICGKPYKIGTRILKDTKTGKWVEADCYFPSHKRNANPERSQSQSGEITNSNSTLPALDEADIYARDLMSRAIKMAHEEMPSWEETSEYPYLISTLIQTMHAKLTSDRISKQEAEKLKAYGNKKW
jgi:hypothetical protein